MNLKITDLLDEYMDDNLYMDPAAVPDTKRIKEAAMKRINKQRNIRPLRVALIAAAIVVVLTGTVLAVMHYTGITDSMEENWNLVAETEMTSEHKDFIEQRSAGIGESVTDQGITVTMDSVTCTTDAAYIYYSVELDPEIYDLDLINSCSDALSSIYVNNEEYGTVWSSGGGSSGSLDEDGSNIFWRETRARFSELPDGANLGDGKTTMHIEIDTFWLASSSAEDIPDVTGTWNFEFPLPETETAEAKTSDAVLNFGNGVQLTIEDISVNEAGCQFTVITDNEEYIFVGGEGELAALARAAEPDAPIFTLYANLSDGSMAYGGAGMTLDESTGTDRWQLDWVAPVDPESVVSLIFSDGETEMEIPLSE